MMCYVTKATPIHFINSKCDIKFNQSHRVYITPLVINTLGADTHTYSDIADKSNQENTTGHRCAWFKINGNTLKSMCAYINSYTVFNSKDFRSVVASSSSLNFTFLLGT